MNAAVDVVERKLLEHGRNVKRRGDKLTAQCPAHEDGTPSLSVAPGRDRDVILKCHAGCDADAVMDALGLEWTDLGEPQQKMREEAVYPYHDENGRVLFEVVRFSPKTFRQRRPDGTWGLGGTRRVIYRLPQVVAAVQAGDTVWVAEGEKDVHALEAAGAAATCCPMGAGKWSGCDYSALDGARVVVVADRDKAGYDHAAEVAWLLEASGCAVTTVEPAVGKDAADHLAAGHGLDEFNRIDLAKHGKDDDWPDPTPLDAAPTGPPFPVHVLPDWIADQVLAVADSFQVPPDLPAMLALGALATVAAGRARVELTGGNWKEDLNLYLSTALPPGVGKSPVYKIMLTALDRLEQNLIDADRENILRAEAQRANFEKRAKAAHEIAVKEPERLFEAVDLELAAANVEVPPERRLMADDATPEALVKLVARHGGRMALLSAEGGVFDTMAGVYADHGKPVNLDVYLKGWSGDSLRRDRVRDNETQIIPKVLLTICVTTQPGVLEKFGANAEAAMRGLPVRFMFSVPEANVGRRDRRKVLSTIDAAVQQRWEERLYDIGWALAGLSTPRELQLTEEARDVFLDWDQEMEHRIEANGDLGGMAEWVSKLRATVLRVAGLLHLADDHHERRPVESATVERALDIAGYWLAHAKVVHGIWQEDPTVSAAGRIVEWARRADLVEFTASDVHVKLRRLFLRIDDVVPALTWLVENHWCRAKDGLPIQVGRRGKPSPVFTLRSDTPPKASEFRAIRAIRVEGCSLSLPPSISHSPSPPPQTNGANGAKPPSGDHGPVPAVDNPFPTLI